MSISYFKTLRETIKRRKETRLSNVTPIIITVAALTLALIFLSLFSVPTGKSADYHFINERGLISFFTEFFLITAGVFALAALIAQSLYQNSPHLLWGLFALGFIILALDEFFHLYSITGRILQKQFGLKNFYQWKDMLIILYGMIALVVLVIFLPELFRYPLVFELFCIGFAFYMLQTFMDITRNQTVMDNIIEETFKIFSVSFLAQGTFFGYLGALRRAGSSDKTGA